ncbi:MAG: metallophosphoesterase [Clostridiales bacterium]|jgi:predicted MPP superfamily phosphohydrolase|nr:metallophosphoesterase [Clostridiales bacterium]
MIWITAVAVFAAICIAALRQELTVRDYSLTTKKLSSVIRLALIADLHDVWYGENQQELIDAIAARDPHLVLFAGDIIDGKRPYDATKQLMAALGRKYQCFFVTGNHEHRTGNVGNIKNMLRSLGVKVLSGDAEYVTTGGGLIKICGLDDPEESRFSRAKGAYAANRKNRIHTLMTAADEDVFTVLLTHRPEWAREYSAAGFDLVTAGHAHGGQVRLPGIINGLYAPNQGLFPKYAGGSFKLGKTTMIVSRGLSRGRIPRVFNPPELVVIELRPGA